MDPVIVLIACALIAWLFAASAWTKLQSPVYTMGVIDNYQVLPLQATKPIVVLLSLIEMSIAIAVILPASRQWAAASAAVMLLVYGLAIGINIARGRTDFDCGCQGPASRDTSIGSALLWRNLVLIVVAGCALAPVSQRALHWFDYSVVILAAAFIIMLYQTIETLLANHRQLIKL